MIGVAAPPSQTAVIHEFFELFKTPWEPLVPGKRYDVVLSADGQTPPGNARLAIVYGNDEHPVDRDGHVPVTTADRASATCGTITLPVYRGAASLDGSSEYRRACGETTIHRVGYDLFAEIGHLLKAGQPNVHAAVPTLELHIEIIRQSLRDAGVAFVEVPARPHGAAFICCLTHDLDFFGIRRHRIGRTLAGFALRGTVGSVVDTVRGRRPVNEAMRNVAAVLSLPLIFAGLRRDLWDPFRDYAQADRGHRSTFFLVPFRDQPGVTPEGGIEPRRAVAYGIQDIQDELRTAVPSGSELAVHGIDAWRDAEHGRAERRELTSVTHQPRTGVRVHWLYFASHSPRALEDAGFDYDSTCGYNDAVGFRAGTMQAFRPLGAERLMELPLTIMDSAMFYADRMGLTHEQAVDCATSMVHQARRFGGALVVNWHDRSLAPERQWGRCYEELLNAIEGGGGCFLTAGEAVEWFRWRRSITFTADADTGSVSIAAPELPSGLPPGRIARHGRSTSDERPLGAGTSTISL